MVAKDGEDSGDVLVHPLQADGAVGQLGASIFKQWMNELTNEWTDENVMLGESVNEWMKK